MKDVHALPGLNESSSYAVGPLSLRCLSEVSTLRFSSDVDSAVSVTVYSCGSTIATLIVQ